MKMEELRVGWKNAYYRITCIYISTLVTLIFGFQMYRYFVAAPADQIKQCKTAAASALELVPVIGVFFSG